MSTTTELAELHELIGSLRRCVTSLAAKYGDSPAMRRIANDAERLLNDIDRLDIDTEELEFSRGIKHQHQVTEKIGIPDHDYSSDFWRDVQDGGVGG
jgi:hypothetical protein